MLVETISSEKSAEASSIQQLVQDFLETKFKSTRLETTLDRLILHEDGRLEVEGERIPFSQSFLEAAAKQADIISCATLATEPLIRGAWLQEGQHLDLVGAFKPHMRETDSVALSRARVYVDTIGGALSEAGDILQAIEEEAIKETDIEGDLERLAREECRGRTSDEAITLFKSVGTALEDLAAAELVMRNHNAQ